MKKILIAVFILIAGLAALGGWLLFGSGTDFSEKSKSLYIYTGESTKEAILRTLKEDSLVKNISLFSIVADRIEVWQNIKPGKFDIKRGESIVTIAKTLRSNRQTPVKLTIKKLRVLEDIARIIGKNFEVDSARVMSFLNNPDSLSRFNVDFNTAITIIIPNTYNIYWNLSTGKILDRLREEKNIFWQKKDRLQKAEQMALTPDQVYTIASIVEEETNKNDEKGNVASVYINRYHKGMPLGADPTIKFALKDFGLRRIYFKHLQVESPFNTYRNKGLPPGPICTPSPVTIDAVLNAPKTDYLFFVASSDFNGYHSFSENFAEHKKKAVEYQKALDALILRKQKAKENP